jgi:pimeloyl-ACP methyl ester carboxylesterase
MSTTSAAETVSRILSVRGIGLHAEQRGEGPALLLIHGGGEDSSMLAGQADDLAAAGYRVITYDRRGTGKSGRHDWPGNGADQHADDAAALLTSLGVGPAVIVGVSSGGVIAMTVAARHPDVVSRVVAWEPPALGVVPGGAAANAAFMAPVEAHLAAHPDDYVGAQALLLTAILGTPVTVDDPALVPARANAEPMIRDEPQIPLRPFTADELATRPVTVAVGSAPNEVIALATEVLAELIGSPTVVASGEHEIYLFDPRILTSLVGPPAADA